MEVGKDALRWLNHAFSNTQLSYLRRKASDRLLFLTESWQLSPVSVACT